MAENKANTDKVKAINELEDRVAPLSEKNRSDKDDIDLAKASRLRGEKSSVSPANDDSPDSGALAKEIMSAPERTPFIIAALVSILWLFGAGAYLWGEYGALMINESGQSLTGPQIAGLCALAVIPVTLFWAIAYMVWRAQHMRIVSAALAQTAMRLIHPEDEAKNAVETLGQAVKREVDTLVNGVDIALSRASELEGLVHGEISELERAFNGNEQRIQTLLDGLEHHRVSLEKTGGVLGDQAKPVLSSLQSHTDNLKNIITEAMDNMSVMETGMRDQADHLTSAITAATSAADTSLSNISTEADKLENTSEHLLGNIDKFTRQLSEHREALSTVSEDVTSAHQDLSTKLVASSEEMSKRLASASDHLVSTVDQTSARMSGHIEETSTHMTARLQEVSSGITGKLEETGNLILNRLQTVGQIVDNSAGEIHENLDGVLDKHMTELNAISGTLSDRASDIEKMMHSYSQLVDDSLTAAEKRAHDVAEMMTSHTTGSAKKMLQDLSEAKAAAEAHLTDSQGQLNQQYQQTVETLAKALDKTNEDFANVTHQMRGLAEQMTQELENTRGELQRAIVELPHEAKSNAAAMRQVVADQISALTALSDVVKRHSTHRDVATPPQMRAPLPPQRPLENRTPPASYMQARPVPPRPQAPLAPPPAPSAPQQSMAPATPAAPAPMAPIAPIQQSYQRSAPASAPTQSAAPSDDYSLSDVLAAASRNEQASYTSTPNYTQSENDTNKTALHIVEALNALAVDLARALDNEPPADLWNRYQGGERNVFTARLYALRSDQMFDEIKHKYKSDGDFRRDVDRYIDEFERLLDTVSRNDRDNMLVETYLSTETGKVYLMLAHACGRLN